MKKNFLAVVMLLLGVANVNADRLVGGDLSMVPAYETSGDKWLDAKGEEVNNLLTYVKEQCGWNAVRVRLFVDPSKDAYKSTCQDLDYVKALGKHIKDAGMAFLLDFHYSDTWADPGAQQIPSSWTDHTQSGLCKQVYEYTYESVQALVNAGAKPDYVQIGNEITYGLLWNTADGKYPTDKSTYASVGYCTTWENDYATDSAWPRTAALLDNAAQGVHKAFQNLGLDSTSVKVVVHTELSGSSNSDNFYKHIRTAGFNNYDVIGLSYYPTEHGDLASMGQMLTTLKNDFPEKEVQIVETGYYNEGKHTTKYDYTAKWPYTAVGQYTFLTDLIARLKQFDNVNGLYYWMPEECGNGHNQTVWDYTFNRGFWKCSSAATHSLVTTATGAAPIQVLQDFLTDEVEEGAFKTSDYFENLDFETGDLTGWTSDQSWTTMWPNDISSWASAEVVQGSYTLELWNASASEGSVISTGATVPNGRYTITCKAHANQDGFYLWANKKKTVIAAGENAVWSVTTDVTDKTLEFGIGIVGSSTERYLYADDFTVTYVGEAIGDIEEDVIEGDKTDNYIDAQQLEYALWPESGTAGVVSGQKAIGTEVDGVIDIPSIITVDEKDYYVTYIEANAFANNTTLTDVTIGKSVYEILGSAFSGCYNLKSVTFADDSSLGSIASWAFHNTALESVTVPAGVKTIPEGCFAKCWALKSVKLLAEDLTSIGKFAFSTWAEEGCERSWSTFDDGFMIYAATAPTIDANAFHPEDIANAILYVYPGEEENEAYTSLGFAEVKPLSDVTPDTSCKVTVNGLKYAYWLSSFEGEETSHATVMGYTQDIPAVLEISDYLEGVTEDDDIPTINAINAWALQDAPISKVEISDLVTEIPEGAFAGCASLGDMVLYGDIKLIGDFAFSNWAEEGCVSKGAKNQDAFVGFRSVVIYSKEVPEISAKAFCVSDVAEATLYVNEALVADAKLNTLGFKAVKPVKEYVDAIAGVMAEGNAGAAVFDLSGRQVSGKLQHGVYVSNGKKYLK